MGAGQFCTNPDIAVAIDGPEAEAFIAAAHEALSAIRAQAMLTDGIAAAFRAGRDRVAGAKGVRAILTTMCDQRQAPPYLYEVSGTDWLADYALGEEVFGPLGLIIRLANMALMLAIVRSLQGQLTCTLHPAP